MIRGRFGVICLASEIENHMFEILSFLDHSEELVGSGLLSKLFSIKGFELSEATVGRILRRMDQEKWTLRVGFQGRAITKAGRSALTEMRNSKERLMCGNQFIKTLESKKIDDLLDILVARKAIERELARLAALNASPEEIQLLESMVLEQERHMVKERISAEHDVKFHKLLAVAAKNKVLTATMELIRYDAQLSPVLELIRNEVEREIVIDHSEIVKAIKERNPDKAETAMILHVDSLILEVKKYWNLVKK
jgi:GntR family transcriptional repressor for pyruvate dehydrogenase complex